MRGEAQLREAAGMLEASGWMGATQGSWITFALVGCESNNKPLFPSVEPQSPDLCIRGELDLVRVPMSPDWGGFEGRLRRNLKHGLGGGGACGEKAGLGGGRS